MGGTKAERWPALIEPRTIEPGADRKREFRWVAAEPFLVERLDRAKGSGAITSYAFSDDVLTVWRPWIAGNDALEEFSRLKGVDRITFSHLLFRNVAKILAGGVEHGALHPGNVLLQPGGGFKLVDGYFNKVLLNPREVPKDGIWLWGPCIPAGWTIADWDAVSLLRTAALLSKVDTSQPPRRSDEEVKLLCRQWADGATRNSGGSQTNVTDYLNWIQISLELLARIPAESISVPPFPLEDHLQGLLDLQAPKLLLGEQQEVRLRSQATSEALAGPELDSRIDAWLLLKGARREREVLGLVANLLEAGLDGGPGKWVSIRSIRLAEQLFISTGFGRDSAAEQVGGILQRSGWRHGGEVVESCRRRIAESLDLRSGEPEPAVVERLAAEFSRSQGLSPHAARRLFDVEIEARLLGLG